MLKMPAIHPLISSVVNVLIDVKTPSQIRHLLLPGGSFWVRTMMSSIKDCTKPIEAIVLTYLRNTSWP
jgi:hypothetical protein